MKAAIRIGVIGAGYWGPNLIRNCAELGVLDSVCDINGDALEKVRSLYPSVATVTSMSELWDRPINAVVIAAPAQLHSKMALEAIAAGKHVFVEKPLALTVAEGVAVHAAAKAARLQVVVGHLLLYHPAVVRMRSLIAENAIGNLWHIRFRRLQLGKLRSHESVWWSFAPHDIAVMLAIMGSEPLSVSASQTSYRVPDISDVAYADFTFTGGKSAHLEVCWLDPTKSARIDVFGTEGVLSLEDRRGSSELTLTKARANGTGAHSLEVIRGDSQRIDVEKGEPLRAELNAFILAIATGKSAETDALEGISVLRALSMADDAAKAHRVLLEASA